MNLSILSIVHVSHHTVTTLPFIILSKLHLTITFLLHIFALGYLVFKFTFMCISLKISLKKKTTYIMYNGMFFLYVKCFCNVDFPVWDLCKCNSTS